MDFKRAPNGDLRVQIETRTHACCHLGSGAGAPMVVNLDPHPHPTGAKPIGDPPPRVQIVIPSVGTEKLIMHLTPWVTRQVPTHINTDLTSLVDLWD
jgi:hypothetical protein